jgi:hypothetical protein
MRARFSFCPHVAMVKIQAMPAGILDVIMAHLQYTKSGGFGLKTYLKYPSTAKIYEPNYHNYNIPLLNAACGCPTLCEIAMARMAIEDTSAWDDKEWDRWRWRVNELGRIVSEETSNGEAPSNEDPQSDEEIQSDEKVHVPRSV